MTLYDQIRDALTRFAGKMPFDAAKAILVQAGAARGRQIEAAEIVDRLRTDEPHLFKQDIAPASTDGIARTYITRRERHEARHGCNPPPRSKVIAPPLPLSVLTDGRLSPGARLCHAWIVKQSMLDAREHGPNGWTLTTFTKSIATAFEVTGRTVVNYYHELETYGYIHRIKKYIRSTRQVRIAILPLGRPSEFQPTRTRVLLEKAVSSDLPAIRTAFRRLLTTAYKNLRTPFARDDGHRKVHSGIRSTKKAPCVEAADSNTRGANFAPVSQP